MPIPEDKARYVRELLEAVGADEVSRPFDTGVVYGNIKIPIAITDSGTTQVISGTAAAGLWDGDPNLANFMPDTGRFGLVFDTFQLQISQTGGLDPSEVAALSDIALDAELAYTPKLAGGRTGVYPAVPGAVFVPTLTAVSTAGDSTEGIVAAQFPWVNPIDIGFPIAVDMANDTLALTIPTVAAAPTSTLGWLYLPKAIAFSYDTYPDAWAMVTNADPGTPVRQRNVLRKAAFRSSEILKYNLDALKRGGRR